jgi:hypothetical protein
MLSVQIEKLIKSASDNIKQWETLFNLASHSHYSALIKECALDDVVATIKDVDMLIGSLSPELLNLVNIRVRKHPYTTAYCLFPALNTDNVIAYLETQGIVKSYELAVVYDNDKFSIDVSSNKVSHVKGDSTQEASYSGCYLLLEFENGTSKVWYMDEYEMHSAFDAWQNKVFGGMDVFNNTLEWAGFALILRALKTLDMQDSVISHPILPVLKSRLTSYYSDFFKYYKEANNDKFASCVITSQYVSTEGGELEEALKKLDDIIEPPANIIVLGQHHRQVSNEDTEMNEASEDQCEFYNLDFGVI